MNNPSQPNLIISDFDFKILEDLIAVSTNKNIRMLEEEISQATIVPQCELPANAVCIKSSVSVESLDSGEIHTYTLVLPNEAKIEQNKISILAPMGMALIGLQEGQEYKWPMPDGREKSFRIHKVCHLNSNEN